MQTTSQLIVQSLKNRLCRKSSQRNKRSKASKAIANRSALVEKLENRELFSVSSLFMSGSTWVVRTDNASTSVQVGRSGADIRISEVGSGRSWTRSGVAQVEFQGGNGNDRFVNNVSTLPVRAFGGAGNDYLEGYNANDVLVGGDGDDTLVGYGGDDQMWGGNGNDTLRGMQGNDYLVGGEGNDIIKGDEGNDQLWGQNGHDQLFAGLGDDNLVGGDGNDVLVSIDGDTNDDLWGGNGDDSFWVDREGWSIFASNDKIHDATTFEQQKNVHKVDRFSNGADKTLNGDNLADPTDSGTMRNFKNLPLFSRSGPSSQDIDQGGVGDCWLMSGLGSAADANANSIRQTVVDLGDGTYGVELGGKFYRVDADLPTVGSGNSLRYAGLGQDDSLWTAIVEKAYAFFRTGAGTYASLSGGWASSVYDALGDSSAVSRSFTNGADALRHIAGELSAGKAVVVNILSAQGGAPVVGQHAYIVERVNYQIIRVAGISLRVAVSVVLRNPWGVDGAGSDGVNDARVTVTGAQLAASMYTSNGIQSAHLA